MAKELKEIIVEDFKSRFGSMTGCVLIDYHGLSAEQTVELRGALRERGVRMSVIHNRLLKRALADREDVPPEFTDLLRGPVALLHGTDDDGVLAASKSVIEWRKKNKDLAEVKGGLLDGKLLSFPDVDQLARVPDRPTLLAQTAAHLLSPLQVLASAAAGLLQHFPGCAKARSDELGSEADGA